MQIFLQVALSNRSGLELFNTGARDLKAKPPAKLKQGLVAFIPIWSIHALTQTYHHPCEKVSPTLNNSENVNYFWKILSPYPFGEKLRNVWWLLTPQTNIQYENSKDGH